jgi:hypothetical protein
VNAAFLPPSRGACQRAQSRNKKTGISRAKTQRHEGKTNPKEVVELRKLGMETVMNLIYSIPPRHTDAYHAQKARDDAALTTSVKLRNRIA